MYVGDDQTSHNVFFIKDSVFSERGISYISFLKGFEEFAENIFISQALYFRIIQEHPFIS